MTATKYWDGSQWVTVAGAPGPPGGSRFVTIVGDGAASAFTIIHGFATRDVLVTAYRNTAPFDEVELDVERTDVNTVTIRTLPYVPALGELTVVVATSGMSAALAVAMDPWHTVGAAGEPAFGAGWSQFAAEEIVGFRKLPDGRVKLKGLANAPAPTSTAFTLPVGYRPLKTWRFTVPNSNGISLIMVLSDGTVQSYNLGAPYTALAGWLDFSDVEFDTETVTQSAVVGAQPMEGWHIVGAAGEPVFTGGFVALDAPRAPRFRKYPDGTVRLAGSAKTGASGSGIFTLPVGFRPPGGDQYFIVLASGGTGYIQVVASTGNVIAFNLTGNVTTQVELNGVEFDTESVAAYASGFMGPPLVTALPANPVDGQECHFLADATNGVVWRLRYRAAAPGSYKWECVGGSPLHANVSADETFTADGAYRDVATLGPDVTVPLAGDYTYEFAAMAYNGTAGPGSIWIGLVLGAGASPATPHEAVGNYPSSAYRIAFAWHQRMTGLTAGQLLRLRYAMSGGGTAHATSRRVMVTPIRVG